MGTTIASLSEVLGQAAKLHRLLEEAGLPPGALQVPIDDPAKRQRLVDYWIAGMPEIPPPSIVFEELQTHRTARAILGKDFHGLDTMQQMKCLTEEEVEKHLLLRLRNEKTQEFLSEEATLKLLESCKGTHVLCAVPELDLPAVHSRKKERFTADPDNPWFGDPKQRKKWAGVRMQDPWVLVGKTIVPGSNGQAIDRQVKQMEGLPNERYQTPAEFGYVAIVHFEATGEKLCEGFVVRFNVQTPGSFWVVACWRGGQVNFSNWDGDACGSIGSASARTS